MLLKYLLSALILGFIVAVPPGSVTIVACQRSMQFGFSNSIYFTLGSCISDIFYLMLVFFGISGVIIGNTFLKIILGIFCGILLLYFGISTIISSNATGSRTDKNLNTNPLYTFTSGILITLTNPVTIVGWLAIAGNFMLVWAAKFPEYRKYPFLTILFIMCGVLCWFIPLTYFTGRLGRILSQRVEKILLMITSIALIGFGIAAFGNVLSNLKQIIG